MDVFFIFYIKFLTNVICALLLFCITQNNISNPIPLLHKCIFMGCTFLYSIPFHIPDFILVYEGIIFLFIAADIKNIKKSIFVFIKYTAYFYLSTTGLSIFHTLLFQDWNVFITSAIYEQYKITIISFLAYVFYVLYQNFRRIRSLRSKYFLHFNIVILAACLLQSYSTLYICRGNPHLQMLPVLFSTLIILIVLFISLYDRFITVSDENAHFKIQAEVNRMQKDYALQTEEALKELRSIRHDIKNHLTIIDGYAEQRNFGKIHEYIRKISRRFTDIPLIESPSVLVSAILNEKSMLAQQKNITCEITCAFPYLEADDFAITTILGNLLDNALTAAAKCSKGWIRVSLCQADTLLLINVNNSHQETICEKDGVFTSTKTEQAHLHGIGIKNVERAVKQLNGEMKISPTEDTFHVKISLPNYR